MKTVHPSGSFVRWDRRTGYRVELLGANWLYIKEAQSEGRLRPHRVPRMAYGPRAEVGRDVIVVKGLWDSTPKPGRPPTAALLQKPLVRVGLPYKPA
jgi:hypothetical protein